MPYRLFPYPLLRPGPATPSRVNRIVRYVFGTISDDVIANHRSTSAASIMPACGMRWVLRELDGPPLRRIPVSGRRARLRSGVARIPRCHRDHEGVVVIDALAVPMCSRGLAVDGEPEGVVPEDDGVR